MLDLAELYDSLDAAEQRIQSGVPGDTRRSLDSAVRSIRSTLEEAAKEFLRGNNHPPPKLVLRHIVSLLKREFRANRRLARQVANVLGETSGGIHTGDQLASPPVELVRSWLALARHFLDVLGPILSRRGQSVTGGV